MRHVTLVNRTNGILRGVWDGRHYDLQPGTHSFPEVQAYAFKNQNPVMGSENPQTGEMTYKVGIVEDNDPVTPLAPQVGPEPIERWDRSKLTGAKPSEVVAGDNGLYGQGAASWRAPGLPADAGFVTP